MLIIFLRMALSSWPMASSVSSSFSWMENNSKNFDFLNLLAFTANDCEISRAYLYSSWMSSLSSFSFDSIEDRAEFLLEHTVLKSENTMCNFEPKPLFAPALSTLWSDRFAELKTDWPRGVILVAFDRAAGGGITSGPARDFTSLYTFGDTTLLLEIYSCGFFWEFSKGGKCLGWELRL